MYVITGATGNTGSPAAKALLARGLKVRAIGRNADKLKALAAAGAEPFIADQTDSEALMRAFTGAEAVYVLIPMNIAAQDFRAYQKAVLEAAAVAVEKAGVNHVVTLSSIGADKPDKTGPVTGLHLLEERFNRIAGLNVMHVRAGYFMENTLAQIGIIQNCGVTGGPLRADLKIGMIAARDIGAYAAHALEQKDFSGSVTREIQGQRDLSMTEAAAIIGQAIGKPGLAYMQLPDGQLRPALRQVGFSDDVANQILELSASLNSGYARALEPRSAANTTPTSYETFVAEEFVPRFRGKSAGA